MKANTDPLDKEESSMAVKESTEASNDCAMARNTDIVARIKRHNRRGESKTVDMLGSDKDANEEVFADDYNNSTKEEEEDGHRYLKIMYHQWWQS